MRIVQVCNVGHICGGTAACAWTIARSLPASEHTVLFLRPPTAETIRVFSPIAVQSCRRVDDRVLAPFRPDLVILHNTSSHVVGDITQCPSVLFAHSVGNHAPADLRLACSRWLADRLPLPVEVQYQPVPIPIHPAGAEERQRSRIHDDELIVGRICTPTLRKWSPECLTFYATLAGKFPQFHWEFVGCPKELQQPMRGACQGRARFFPASWEARQHLWRWHVMLYHHPTLTESFGRTVAESMRAGCVPIVDARGGFLEQVQDYETGFLCNGLDAFESALRQTLQPEVRWRMCSQGRENADARFSLRSFSVSFLDRLRSYSMIPSSRCNSRPSA